MNRCPLCGENSLPEIRVPEIDFVDRALHFRGAFVARFGRRESALLDIALRSWPRPAAYERCIYAVWPDDDEPADAVATLISHAFHIRRKIESAGLDLRGINGVGYRFYLPGEEMAALPDRAEPGARHAA